MVKVLMLALVGIAAGCRMLPALPPANLGAPGWTVRQGQAVWRPQAGGEGIAGEILVAIRTNGNAFVEFSKSPFPLVVAQSTPEMWTLRFPPQNEQHSGRGAPPQRVIFLQLPRVMTGLPPPEHWSWRPIPQNGRRLANGASGESLEVYFGP